MEKMQFPQKKFSQENKESKSIQEFVRTFILQNPENLTDYNKKEIFSQLQKEWYTYAENNNLVLKKDENEDVLVYLKSQCQLLSKEKVGYADTPLQKREITVEQNGISCLSSSLILSSILETQNIPYKFLNPVGHIVLEVDDLDKKYYVDSRNNQVVDMTPHIINIEDYKDRDILHFTEEAKGKFYTHASRPKNNEDSLRSVFSNIIVMNNITQGDEAGASNELDSHKQAAISLKEHLSKINFNELEDFVDINFPKEDEYLEKLRTEEVKNLQKGGFYSQKKD